MGGNLSVTNNYSRRRTNMKKVKKELHFKDQVSKEGELIQNMILDHTMIGISWF